MNHNFGLDIAVAENIAVVADSAVAEDMVIVTDMKAEVAVANQVQHFVCAYLLFFSFRKLHLG